MRIRTLIVTIVILVIDQLPCYSQWKKLFDGKSLEGWDTYLGPTYDTVGNQWTKDFKGLNADPSKVFTVVDVDGSPVIRISGENFGGLSTREEFHNYHLRLEFMWGAAKWAPRKNSKRDSGVLYHAVGPHGADFGFWMRSQEFQVQEGDCGDYWGVAGGSFEVRALRRHSDEYVYHADGERLIFNEKSPNGRRVIKREDTELPKGNWNLIEIFCYKDTAIHVMNGKVVMVLTKSGQLENGRVKPLTKGKIQIQSEGAEIFYRNIEWRPINGIPSQFMK